MAVPTELWIASGSAPFTKWTNAAKLRRTYDADVRGYVVELPPVTAGTPKPSLSVALPHPVLVLQLCAPAGTSVSLELTVTDAGGVRRRLAVSTAFTEAKVTALHAQVPLPLPRDTWCTLALCVADLLAAFFGGVALRCTETLTLATVPKLRRIWVLTGTPRDAAFAQTRESGLSASGGIAGQLPTVLLDAACVAGAARPPNGSAPSPRSSGQSQVPLAFGRRVSAMAFASSTGGGNDHVARSSTHRGLMSGAPAPRRGFSAPAGSGPDAGLSMPTTLRPSPRAVPAATPGLPPRTASGRVTGLPSRTVSDSAATTLRRLERAAQAQAPPDSPPAHMAPAAVNASWSRAGPLSHRSPPPDDVDEDDDAGQLLTSSQLLPLASLSLEECSSRDGHTPPVSPVPSSGGGWTGGSDGYLSSWEGTSSSVSVAHVQQQQQQQPGPHELYGDIQREPSGGEAAFSVQVRASFRTSRPQPLFLPLLPPSDRSDDDVVSGGDSTPSAPKAGTPRHSGGVAGPSPMGGGTPGGVSLSPTGWVPPPHLRAATAAATAALHSPPPRSALNGERPQLSPLRDPSASMGAGLWLGRAPASPHLVPSAMLPGGSASPGPSAAWALPPAVHQQATHHGMLHPAPMLLSLSLSPGAPRPEDDDEMVLGMDD